MCLSDPGNPNPDRLDRREGPSYPNANIEGVKTKNHHSAHFSMKQNTRLSRVA